ncbi:hypothetical protein EDB89DRAFT_1905288 [Lactarius sanguifluus]|nr:hypothetical protein EDB89DRAFT_1905288 [Lactarius sanguifluus]
MGKSWAGAGGNCNRDWRISQHGYRPRYPTSDDQVQLIIGTPTAQKAGLTRPVVVDHPNSEKARKVFLSPRRRCGVASAARHFTDGGGGVEGEDARTTFEKRRQQESRREKNGKQKVAKGGRTGS